ncbi:diguanylate cyclase [Thiolapillus sp.]
MHLLTDKLNRLATGVTFLVLALTCLQALANDHSQLRYRSLSFTNLSIEQGLSQVSGNAVIQDSKGFVWIGTQDGLNRFDGHNIRVFRHDKDDPASLARDFISALAEDERGHLWIGTRGKGLDEYDPLTETFRHHQIIPGAKGRGSASDVKKLLVHGQRVYIGTLQGLFYLDRKDNQVRSISIPGLQADSSTIFDLLLMPKGNILISTSWGIFSLNPDTLQLKQKYLDITGPYGSGTNALYHDSKHRLWLSTGKHGVLLVDEENNRLIRHFEHNEDDPDSLRFWNALSFAEDVWGNIWIGSNNGLNLYLDAEDKMITLADSRHRPSGIHDHSVQTLYTDSNQNIWIGTSVGGVSRLSPYLARFSQIIPANDLQTPDKRLLGIAKTPEGGLYVGTSVGLAYRPPGETAFSIIPTVDHQALAAKTTVYGLFISRDGTLWVGSSTGLRRLPPGEKKLHAPELSNSYYFIKMLEDEEGYLWLSRPTELLKYDPRTRKIAASLQLPHVYGMLQLDDARILVGGLGKIHLIDTRSATVLDALDGETHGFNSITYLYQARDGSIWVGTQGDGLFHMEINGNYDLSRAKLTFYSMQDGLASNAIGAIAESADGLIWFTTTRSISRLDPSTGAVQNFDDKDGAFSEGYYIGSGLQDEQGLIYFGGVKGMSIFAPEWIADDPVTPRVIFTALRLDNHPMSAGLPDSPLSKPMAYTDQLTIAPQWSSITLEFASNNYASPEQIRYAYKMQGLEKEWTETGAGERFATYASMPPGKYSFLVKATNPDGKWSPEPTVLTLNILPHWYQTWWAWLLLGLLTTSLIYAYVRLRMGTILRRNLELEKRVNARTKALTEANRQLAHLARTDTLTGMLNRRAFTEHFHHNRENQTSCTQCALALLDIDLFKVFNDSHGHDCGDAVLREMARLLRENLRDNDVVARWGGEEFIILLPNTVHSDAADIMARLCEAVARHRFKWEGETLRITITAGLGQCDCNQSLEKCLKPVDEALYKGKQQGRNQLVLASTPA